MIMQTTQLDLFNAEPTEPQNNRNPRNQNCKKTRNVNQEAKNILERAGINDWSKELKALVAAKLMAEHFPDQHKIMMQMLATTLIKPVTLS